MTWVDSRSIIISHTHIYIHEWQIFFYEIPNGQHSSASSSSDQCFMWQLVSSTQCCSRIMFCYLSALSICCSCGTFLCIFKKKLPHKIFHIYNWLNKQMSVCFVKMIILWITIENKILCEEYWLKMLEIPTIISG